MPLQQFFRNSWEIKSLEAAGLGIFVLTGAGIALLYILGPTHKFWAWLEKALGRLGALTGALALVAMGSLVLWALVSLELKVLVAFILVALVGITFILLKRLPK